MTQNFCRWLATEEQGRRQFRLGQIKPSVVKKPKDEDCVCDHPVTSVPSEACPGQAGPLG